MKNVSMVFFTKCGVVDTATHLSSATKHRSRWHCSLGEVGFRRLEVDGQYWQWMSLPCLVWPRPSYTRRCPCQRWVRTIRRMNRCRSSLKHELNHLRIIRSYKNKRNLYCNSTHCVINVQRCVCKFITTVELKGLINTLYGKLTILGSCVVTWYDVMRGWNLCVLCNRLYVWGRRDLKTVHTQNQTVLLRNWQNWLMPRKNEEYWGIVHNVTCP